MRRSHHLLLADKLRWLLSGVLVAAVLGSAGHAEQHGRTAAPALQEAPAQRLPAARTTRHEIALADRRLAFLATAGALTLRNRDGQPEADIGFVAYVRDTEADAGRPVTFVVNGGPGAASAYLHLGALGPWRLPFGEAGIVPSQPVTLEPNAETWLDFTDLVFVDPVGTGFSRLVEPTDGLRARYLSIDGDVAALADFVLRWLTENGRLTAPKYFVGESYGGFRGPLVAETLQTEFGVALSGMTLVSPVLDFGWFPASEPTILPWVTLLPSLAAAGMERAGRFALADLRAAEDYAAGAFTTDLLRGLHDEAAVARIVARVAELTGLEGDLVARHAGRIDAETFSGAIGRDAGRIASAYDGAVSGIDPAPERPHSRAADPVLDAMTAPLTSAMLALYRETLEWMPERRYALLNRGVNGAWDWQGGRSPPEAVGTLRRVLALDPSLDLLVVHGVTDLVTPYFASTLILRQVPDFGARVRQRSYRGGHMFYTRSDARAAFRADAEQIYTVPGQ